jgi:hypothetical protein
MKIAAWSLTVYRTPRRFQIRSDRHHTASSSIANPEVKGNGHSVPL